MNNLEQLLYDEFHRFELHSTYIDKHQAARMAARIALEIAEKAYYGAYSSCGAEYGCARGNSEFETFEHLKNELTKG